MKIQVLNHAEALAAVPALADVLVNCVYGGASVSFQPPLDQPRAEAFWRQVAENVEKGSVVLLVARDAKTVAGTVQLQFPSSDNQPHRADVAKMLVHSAFRRRGVARELMLAAEAAAKSAGKSLLTLDTQSGSAAEQLYTGLGWERVGVIPGYALTPYNGLCDTTVFFKRLA